ncbi:HAD family hydrolase [Streptomyces sp. B3I8]|uniref:D-glycero-alpha-D-manno-heptose-1,7-bisphosphate 7-phosphatase n=1 Tax=Streptomyces sp. B3I8 TaxID=3042303 RepID=UPI002788C5EA|nr:HAD family hydrolase [Streptomyces sp. B3I8]MDQ0789948.1 D-glycero-D-manno-heptose 1,7-bisphosphate phosphatase [Streptomyces sp. B3I8]
MTGTRAAHSTRGGAAPALRAVLFDRDGTLVEDVPYNGDPERVRPVAGAREALALLRGRGIRTAVVSNQSGVARGLLGAADVVRVNARIDALLGPFDTWAVCPHGPGDGCACRKPAPGLVRAAAERLGVPVRNCAVVGDIGADIEAARRAGTYGVLVPTPVTRAEEIAGAAYTAPDLGAAVRMLLGGLAPGDDRAVETGDAAGEPVPGDATAVPGGPA